VTNWQTVMGVAVLAGVLAAAAPPLKSSWRNMDPAATPVSKVIVIGLARDVATRRSMEDALVAEIRKSGAAAEPSYTVVPGELPREPEALKAMVSAGGFDGAAIVRLAGVSREQAWDYVAAMPGYYANTWSYWGYWYPYAWDPFYLREETTVRVETVVYPVTGVMIWSGLSESTNPGSARDVIRQVAVAVGAELKKRNVVR